MLQVSIADTVVRNWDSYQIDESVSLAVLLFIKCSELVRKKTVFVQMQHHHRLPLRVAIKLATTLALISTATIASDAATGT